MKPVIKEICLDKKPPLQIFQANYTYYSALFQDTIQMPHIHYANMDVSHLTDSKFGSNTIAVFKIKLKSK